MKRKIFSVVVVLALVTGFSGCKISKEKAVEKFAIEFAEMVQNKDEKGIRRVYPEVGDISSAHLEFNKDKIDIFPEDDNQYKIRYEDGSYIIVKRGLNNAMEVVKSEGIFSSTGATASTTSETTPVPEEAAPEATATAPVEVAPLHQKKKSTPAGLPNYDWLSYKYADYDDVAYKSGSELRIMRNYIYARHDYKFKSPDLQKYFAQYSWYTPRYSDVSSQLNKIEQSNVQYIKSFE